MLQQVCRSHRIVAAEASKTCLQLFISSKWYSQCISVSEVCDRGLTLLSCEAMQVCPLVNSLKNRVVHKYVITETQSSREMFVFESDPRWTGNRIINVKKICKSQISFIVMVILVKLYIQTVACPCQECLLKLCFLNNMN